MCELEAGGILRCIGDEGPNVIEIDQRSDGEVEVLGDGVRHMFEGVNEVVARTGDGDDQLSVKYTMFLEDGTPVRSPLPFILNLDTGAGNDTTRIDDDGLITFWDLNDVRSLADIRVDLGTGADYLSVALNNHRNVSLGVLSADGGDRVEAPILINVCQPPSGGPSFHCGLRASMQLGGDDNDVRVSADGFDQVDLDLVALSGGNTVQFVGEVNGIGYMDDDFPPWCVISLDFGGGGNLVDASTEGFDDVELSLTEVEPPTSSPSTLGLNPTSFSFSATAGGTTPDYGYGY